MEDPLEWITDVVEKSCKLGLGKIDQLLCGYLLPESLVPPAHDTIQQNRDCQNSDIQIGCQGVFWEDIEIGGNFGALTSNLPARSAFNIGAQWAIIGHSEERKAKLDLLKSYDASIQSDSRRLGKALDAVNGIIGREVSCAINSGLKVLLCIGETAEERGSGAFLEQKPRIRQVLEKQIAAGVSGLDLKSLEGKLVFGYEPVWAIGPGKTPPDQEYISFVSSSVKEYLGENYGVDFPVVYGGGLKKENAGMLASIKTLDGGLVALTKFTGEIGFTVEGLAEIIDCYLGA